MGEEAKKFKKANVRIPTITPSNHTVQLREDNNRLICKLEKLERGPLGFRQLFRNV